MRTAFLAALWCGLALAPAAEAEFVIQGQAPPVAAPPPAEAASPTVGDKPASRRATIRPRFAIARGFGDDVPLAFAVRQIVPKAVKIHYGPGADPTDLVTWKGGQSWNRVLAAAVAPLGLHLVMTTMAVEIRN